MVHPKPPAARFAAVCSVAVLAFVPLFVTGGMGALDFWTWMSLNNLALFCLASWADPTFLPRLLTDAKRGAIKKILFGAVSAAVLYAVFWIGNILSRELFSFAGEGIDSIYGLKSGSSLLKVGLLIGLVFGPGEEFFWRGFVQNGLAALRPGSLRWTPVIAATLLYGGVHLGSGNPMLVLAASICGLYWGILYAWSGSMVVCAVSHTLWDLSVFLFFPLA